MNIANLSVDGGEGRAQGINSSLISIINQLEQGDWGERGNERAREREEKKVGGARRKTRREGERFLLSPPLRAISSILSGSCDVFRELITFDSLSLFLSFLLPFYSESKLFSTRQ